MSQIQPLWQLLLESVGGKRPLTCSECFTILEYLAGIVPRDEAGYDTAVLQQAVDQHLTTCPDCRHYYEERLQELEEFESNGSSLLKP